MKLGKKRSALTAGIGYTLGNVLIKGINFLTLPIFSRIMSPEAFGVFNVFMSYDAILYVVIGLAMHTSIRSANSEFKGRIDEYTSSVSLIYLVNALVLTVVVALFGRGLSRWMGFQLPVLFLLVLYSTGFAVLTLYEFRISLDYSFGKYLAISLCNSLGNVALSLVLILTAFRDNMSLGRILGCTLVSVILTIVLLLDLYRRAKPRASKEFWKFGVKYSLPIVPHGISQVLLSQFDRVMIRSMVSDAAAGIYSLAANIKLILTVITTSVSTAWSTWFYVEMDKGNRHGIRRRSVQLGALFVIFTVGLLALSPELIWLLGGEEYALGRYIAVPMVLDAFVLFISEMLGVGEYYAKKTVYIMAGTIAAAVLNVVLNYVFILRYGFLAAAYTTLAAYICYMVIHVVICRKLIGYYILPLRWLLVYCAIAAGMAALTLVFVDQLLIRWGICALIVIPMAIILLKSYRSDRKHASGCDESERRE